MQKTIRTVGSQKRHSSFPTQCDPYGAFLHSPSVHTLPSWDPTGRFVLARKSACWVPRVNWNNKKDRFFTCLPFLIPSKLNTEILFCIFHIHSQPVRISPRPISICQLHALLHFHLKPIYLILSKGSYLLG